MKKFICLFFLVMIFVSSAIAQKKPLFASDLSNAEYPAGVWSFTDGVLTATQDQCIWTKKDYSNFVLDLEFRNADSTNSGVIIYCSDPKNWIPNSMEVQIADDYCKKWAESPKSWQCAAIFGHLPATKRMVKKPGKWNHMTITCMGKNVKVKLNGQLVTEMDMNLWTSATVNPDGTDILPWLKNVPLSTLQTHGRIGLQGKHAGAPIWFRNLKVEEIR